MPNSSSYQIPARALETAYTVEYYYRVKWGLADEFLRLFRKNHYPVLQKQLETGRMLAFSTTAPKFHGTEAERWDYRVTIKYKNVVAAHDSAHEHALLRVLYPDQETFAREEQRRWELIIGHWDLPITDVVLE